VLKWTSKASEKLGSGKWRGSQLHSLADHQRQKEGKDYHLYIALNCIMSNCPDLIPKERCWRDPEWGFYHGI